MKQRFSAFTLIEVVVALTLFSFVIIGVLLVVTRAYRYVENSKMQVMAVNLAREGIEMIYNIRDTNWRKYSGAKDINWLRRDPFGGSTDLITEGYYTLDMKLYSDQQYSTLTKIESVNEDVLSGLYVDISSYLDTTAANTFKVAFTGGYYSGTTLVASADDLMSKEADFYRIVYVNGLYSKKSGSSADSTCASAGGCAAGDPQELRFCVKVFAVNTHVAQAEICSMMTNFRK